MARSVSVRGPDLSLRAAKVRSPSGGSAVPSRGLPRTAATDAEHAALLLPVGLPYEPEQPQLRASDADREVAVERLRDAALEGRLDADELEQRLADAYAARWRSELTALTTDITPPPDPLTFIRPASEINTLAVVSLVSGLLWAVWIGSFTAIVTGHLALHRIARSAGTQTGRTMAIIGLGLGYLSLAPLAMILIFGLP
jgi:uncharacterized protein DUF1707/uncharacterized protein DUF4190